MAPTGFGAVTRFPVSSLHFDKENPRLAEYGVTRTTTDSEILKILWVAMDIKELVQSIAASGYFPHEPIIVAHEKGRNVVIEGNRRLAAVKVLLAGEIDDEGTWPIPQLSRKQKDALSELPVIESSRKDSWRYLGFKHVNGPAKWSSYAKAKYIAEVHQQFDEPLEAISEQIGDRHRTVQRLYRGLMVIEQAEAEKVFDREDKFRPRFAFSHLYTGLDYEGIANFLEIKESNAESKTPVPKAKKKELGELCLWLFGSRREKIPPVIESQNPDLRRLDAVVRSREAISALRGGEDLNTAFNLSRPSDDVFEESLLKGKRELTRASAVLTSGYRGSSDLLEVAKSIVDLATDIVESMTRRIEKRDRLRRKKAQKKSEE